MQKAFKKIFSILSVWLLLSFIAPAYAQAQVTSVLSLMTWPIDAGWWPQQQTASKTLTITVNPAPSGTNFYIANSSAGSGTGADCANALSYTFFNNSANWGGGSGHIAPASNVHVCGTISNTLTVAGNGSNGSPVALVFESGGKLSQAVCPFTGCLNIDGHSDIYVDGFGTVDGFGHLSTPQGTIEATANGSTLANQVANSRCIQADSSIRVTITRLLVQNCYVHTLTTDTVPSAPDPTAIHAAGAQTFKVMNSIIHDANWAVYGGNGVGPIEVGFTELYHIDHGLAVGVVNETFTGASLHDSHMHDPANWDTTLTACSGNPCYHHDGTHMYRVGTGHIYNINTYNNVFDGDWGDFTTAQIYTELADGTQNIWNNVFIGTGGGGGRNLTNGMIACTVGSAGVCHVWNNTILAGGSQSASNITLEGVSADFRNNLVNGGAAMLAYTSGLTIASGGFDYNDFVNGASGSRFFIVGTGFTTYAAMNTHFSGANSHSPTSATVGVDSNGVPLNGAPLKGAGFNLSGQGISTLNSDTSAGASRTPVARGTTWDIGAYKSAF